VDHELSAAASIARRVCGSFVPTPPLTKRLPAEPYPHRSQAVFNELIRLDVATEEITDPLIVDAIIGRFARAGTGADADRTATERRRSSISPIVFSNSTLIVPAVRAQGRQRQYRRRQFFEPRQRRDRRTEDSAFGVTYTRETPYSRQLISEPVLWYRRTLSIRSIALRW